MVNQSFRNTLNMAFIHLLISLDSPTRARPMRFEEKGVFSEGILGEVIAASIFLSCDKGLPNGDDKALERWRLVEALHHSRQLIGLLLYTF